MPDWYYGLSKAPKGSIAVIPLKGVVMKYDYCGAPGTKTIANWMIEADNNPNIIGIIQLIDSGGGSADGTLAYADCIKSLKKPVVTYIDGMACSAAYWAASPSKEIYASSPIDIVGSIGTYLTLYDFREYLKAEGISEHIIYATKSTLKNDEYKKAIGDEGNEPNYQPMLDNYLDPINEAFINAVRKNRKALAQLPLNHDLFKGQSPLAKDAVGTLIDGVKPFSFALNRVKILANQANS
jgi:protease IV